MKTKSRAIDEDALVERILPRVEEKVRTDIVRSLISALEEQIYPPEEALRDEFVKRVEKASKSKGKVFKTAKELKAHLKKLGK